MGKEKNWTIVKIEIPSPIKIEPNMPVKFIYKNIEHILTFELVDSPLNPFKNVESEFMEIPEDKYGIVNRSMVTLYIAKLIDPTILVEMDILSPCKDIPLLLKHSIDALNYFIERYRIITGKYWVETVFHKMITNYGFKLIEEGRELNTGFKENPNIYCIKSNPDYLNPIEIEKLKDYLKKDNIHLWKSLLMDSKDYQLRGHFREAIYAINGALENFIRIKANKRLKKSLNIDEIDIFLHGKPEYEEFFLKDYISKESFDEAIKVGIIKNEPPSVYQILKKCHKIKPFSDYDELKGLISTIRSKRNISVHGKEYPHTLEDSAMKAIDAFEKFVKDFQRN
ncbi:MAG: hypothetical protein ACP5C3_03230 [Methanomicrobiales archaeon]